MMKTCETCKFFWNLTCRYGPPANVPVASGLQSPGQNPIYIPEAWWPMVKKTDWCGKWEDRWA